MAKASPSAFTCLTDNLISKLSNDIGNYKKFRQLGLALEIPLQDMIDIEEKIKNEADGIATLLIKWRKGTEPENKQIPKLKAALKSKTWRDVAKSFFAELEKMDKALKAANEGQISKKGKAATSTATADNKPMTKSTPPKKSAVKEPQDGSKPGASKKPAKAKDAPKDKTSTLTIEKTTKSRTVIKNK